uniref:Fucosyltransferase n=1 Tax=Salarias fasciatus TaxID=181472 RepID=A0A672F3G6_SALFA
RRKAGLFSRDVIGSAPLKLQALRITLVLCAPAPRRNLTVLLWHWPFGRSYRLDGNRCLAKYNISHCFLTDDPSAFPEADVVVFHHQELSRSAPPLHLPRPASQHWLNGLFNWTMSYRRDADVFVPYGKTVVGGNEPHFQVSTNRSCLVGWVISRYQARQARARVYHRLKRLVPIEVYGRWKRKPLPSGKLLPTIAKCLFYLSFENSEAKDYITEKLWRNAFQAGAVPVVLGPSRATYESLAPPHSFIHVSDFNSTEDLAAYLKELAADRKAYEEYFLWRRTHSIKTYTDWRERLCQICLQHPHLPTRKVYQDLERWVHSTDSD